MLDCEWALYNLFVHLPQDISRNNLNKKNLHSILRCFLKARSLWYSEIEHNFWDDPNHNYQTLKGNKKDGRQIVFDNEYFAKAKEGQIDHPFKDIPNKVTLYTYVRNQIHH